MEKHKNPEEKAMWKRIQNIGCLLALLGALTGLLGFVGLASEVRILKQMLTTGPTITMSSVMATIALGIATFLLFPSYEKKQFPETKRVLGYLLALLVTFIAAGVITEYILKIDLGIDIVLYKPEDLVRFPGRMSPESASCFLLLGSSLLVRDLPFRLMQSSAFLACIIGLAIPTLVLTGYLNGEITIYSPFFHSDIMGMSPNTAISLLLTSLASLLSWVDRPHMIPLTKISGGGMITRRLILAFFLIPFLLGLLQYIAHEAGIWTRPILQALTLYLAISFFLVLTWITARKIDNLEEDLKRSIINLKQLERLREEWISIVAHDLRQPINVIGMAANILNDLKDKVTKDEAETIRIISTNALKLNRLINDLLNASQIEARRLSIERRKTDLVSLLKKTVTLFEKQVPERQISLQTPKETPCLAHIDPDRIEQVLDNLFSNAVKYSDQATPIEITLTHLPNEFQIAVSNHGKEIDKDQIPNIFTRFYRAPGSSLLANGIGLGLYIAKGLVEAHGGKIWVQSIPGNTTFTFALPI